MCPYSYTPSIPCFNFEICKNIYLLSTPTIPYISMCLKPSSRVNGELEVYIDVGGRLSLTKEEWDVIFTKKNADEITTFFSTGSTPTDLLCTPITFVCESNNTDNFILIHVGVNTLIMSSEEWYHVKPMLNCIDIRLQQIQRARECYENRMNFFRKRFKLSRVKTLHEASNLMNNIYDKTSIVDNEIKCYLIEYLFYSCLL